MVKNRAQQVLYRYNAKDENNELEFDEDGIVPLYPSGTIITRHGKSWKVAQASLNQSTFKNEVPVLTVSLTDQI
jgi:hypothetical protein